MSSKGHKKLATFLFFSVLILVVGIALAVLYFILPFFQEEGNELWKQICMWAAVVFAAVGVILVLVCAVLYKREERRQEKLEEQVTENVVAEAEQPAQSVPQMESNVTYIPSMEAYQSINMGQFQSVEEKFDQISKMDRTQFVIYVARLFSRKGYQVKLTPVVDNHDIDLLVEKMGVTIAVGCLISSRILCKEDIVCVKNGRSYYGVNNSMALTNMYFDRTALDYAKAEHMSLVDRNILAEDFMN